MDDKWKAAQALRKTKAVRSKANRRLLGPVEDVIFDEMTERNAHRDETMLHPSQISKAEWCRRQSYYQLTQTPPSNPPSFAFRTMNLFAEGHFTHEKWQEWLRRAGVLWGNWQCRRCDHKWEAQSPEFCPLCGGVRPLYKEVPILNEEYGIIGHTDGWVKDDQGEALLEIKSVGVGTLMFEAPSLFEAYRDGALTVDDLWKRIRRPLATHNRQVQLYMYFLGVHKAIVIYEWKATQEVKEFHIELDMDVVQPMLDGARLVWDSLADGIPPNRPQSATDRSSSVCKYCEFKDACWGPEDAS